MASFRVINTSGSAIAAQKAVCVVGYDKPSRAFKINTADNATYNRMPALGILVAALENNEIGVAVNGITIFYDTSGDAQGDIYYVGTSGAITKTPPYYNVRNQFIGIVLEVGTSGRLYIYPPAWVAEGYMKSGNNMELTGSVLDAGGISGEIVVQKGAVPPTHTATAGCLYVDTVARTLYANMNGVTDWQQIAGGGGANHNILSTTHPDTTAAAVLRGDLMIGVGAAPKWERVAKGAVGTYLRSDGTDALWASIQLNDIPSGVELTANKNAANGYPGLSASSKLTGSQQVYGTAVDTACQGNDARLSDARTPTAHASTHQNAGSDEVATATAGANAIPKAGAGGKLAVGWISVVLASSDLTNDSALEKTANKNAASGYAGLSAGSKIAASQMTAVLASSDLTNDSALEKTANKGAASGYAGLDAGTKVPTAHLVPERRTPRRSSGATGRGPFLPAVEVPRRGRAQSQARGVTATRARCCAICSRGRTSSIRLRPTSEPRSRA